MLENRHPDYFATPIFWITEGGMYEGGRSFSGEMVCPWRSFRGEEVSKSSMTTKS